MHSGLAPLTGWKAFCFPASEILGRGGYCVTAAVMQYPG
jgi:hypothetical protein